MTPNPSDADADKPSAPAPTTSVRVVVDTSVLLRYLIKPGSAIRELLDSWWLNGQVRMVTAPELVAELQDVLARPSIQSFVQPADGQALLAAVSLLADHMPELGPIPVFTRDPKDDKFIACAIAGSAGYVVTTDEDLLVVGEVEGVHIVTPYNFLDQLRARKR